MWKMGGSEQAIFVIFLVVLVVLVYLNCSLEAVHQIWNGMKREDDIQRAD